MKRIVFDIETEPFCQGFRYATSTRMRLRLAPRLRVACLYDIDRDKYRFFGPRQGRSLIRCLRSASELISFNGKAFDILVLRRHLGLLGRVPSRGRHTDVHEIMTHAAGFRVSLDTAVRINLGERKHTSGRKMEVLSMDDLRIACQSDVRHTYLLYQRHADGTLKIPERIRRTPKRVYEPSCDQTPRHCSACSSSGSMQVLDVDLDEMTDGQGSDYLAGLWGIAMCSKCGQLFEWGF